MFGIKGTIYGKQAYLSSFGTLVKADSLVELLAEGFAPLAFEDSERDRCEEARQTIEPEYEAEIFEFGFYEQDKVN